ncbi:hypothetical protein A4A49_38788 [Nicotiana attenuata]|uniref:Uncharacterized protein n=1 Tax=Nicotiana attenuata TaxID=49451 RepID=A0A1J6J492_NICAT|nr:hypothetical protein A4A49_38788 [Nicotiana attenuata]
MNEYGEAHSRLSKPQRRPRNNLDPEKMLLLRVILLRNWDCFGVKQLLVWGCVATFIGVDFGQISWLLLGVDFAWAEEEGAALF